MHEKALMWCCSRLWHGLQTFELGPGEAAQSEGSGGDW